MNFIKYTPLYVTLSLIVLAAGIVSLLTYGLRLSVDFTGGSVLELQLPSAPTDPSVFLSTIKGVAGERAVTISDDTLLTIKGAEMTAEEKQEIASAAAEVVGPVDVVRFDVVGPAISAELLQKTVTAIIIVALFIMWYVGRQFKEWRYGVSAVLAMIHDSLVLVGSFSLLGYFYGVEVDVLFVTAMLTTLSFSVHDTIVVFHRIRELRMKHPTEPLTTLINAAVAGTITRSINNSLTIIFMLLALVLLGGATIKWFAVALLIGAITGTYSSACVALPLLLGWERVEARLRARRALR